MRKKSEMRCQGFPQMESAAIWIKLRVLDRTAPYLSSAFVNAQFAFRGGASVAYVYLDLEPGVDVGTYVARGQRVLDENRALALADERIEWAGQYPLIAARWGLDQPLWLRFWHWFSQVLQGYLGYSMLSQDHRPLRDGQLEGVHWHPTGGG